MKEHIAHVKRVENGEWKIHSLFDHSTGTAEKAKKFSESFQSDEWGWLAGLWHDLGKARPAFQKHIKVASGYVPDASISSEKDPNTNHASTGAMYAIHFMSKHNKASFGRALAYMIAGHHTGLPDCDKAEAKGRSLDDLMTDEHFLAEMMVEDIPAELKEGFMPKKHLPIDCTNDLHLWIRFVFSALVDADFLDTEQFMDGEKHKKREIVYPDMEQLLFQFNDYMERLEATADSGEVNQLRAEILLQTRAKAINNSGIYTMTVPTGGGKTLSSLAFALEHSVKHNKTRIIYAIPYTSIIEQTASIFKSIFDSFDYDVVLEHHSNVEPEENKEATATRLAAENWDMPIVVTTTVQLFESLFAARPSHCRKLHNIANSVIVLDETQLLPPGNLEPIRHVIQLLSKHYGVTFLLTTATPTPSSGYTDALGKKLLQEMSVTELIDQPQQYYQKLKRTTYILPQNFFVRQSWEEIVEQIYQHPTVLTIVNKRDDARELFTAMGKDKTLFHLSALMCPEHRRYLIAEIKKRLAQKLPTRVISTQLVEAGVDFDFPVVFRAAAGLDSIIQAGGRCNREGKLVNAKGQSELGKVIVFIPPSDPPMGLLTTAFQAASSLLRLSDKADLNSPSVIQQYFDKLYAELRDFDSNNVLSLLKCDADIHIKFRTAAQKFQMIEQGTTFTVFVDYARDEEEEKKIKWLLRKLRDGQVDRWIIRKLQPYSVMLYNYQKQPLLEQGLIKETKSGYYVIEGSSVYDNKLGLRVDNQQEGILNSGVI